jgi:hypothetical protein
MPNKWEGKLSPPSNNKGEDHGSERIRKKSKEYDAGGRKGKTGETDAH